MEFFQPGWDNYPGWELSHLFEHGLLKWFHNFPLPVDIVDKTVFPNSVFKFNPRFLVFLSISFVKSKTFCEVELNNYDKCSKLFMRKAATRELSRNLFFLSCWKCL